MYLTIEKVSQIKGRLQAYQSRKNSYVENLRRCLEYQVRDKVFFKVATTNGIVHFRVKGQNSLHFISLFKILEFVGEVAYQLSLPPTLSQLHNVVHISILRKYVLNPDNVI